MANHLSRGVTLEHLVNVRRSVVKSGDVNHAISTLNNSSKFITRQVPIRFEDQLAYIRHHVPTRLLQSGSLSRSFRCFTDSAERIRSHSKDCSGEQQWKDILKSISIVKSTLDEDVSSVVSSLKDEIEKQSRIHRQPLNSLESDRLDDVLQRTHYAVIGLRVLFDFYNAAYSWKDILSGEIKDIDLESESREVVSEKCNVKNVILTAAGDASSHFSEKYGENVDVTIDGDIDASMVCVESHLYFIMLELLKNSMKATIDHNGRENDLPQIKVSISKPAKRDVSAVQIVDRGGGFSPSDKEKIFRFFHTNEIAATPTYTYSGNFGAPFSGLGCGSSLSRVYARYMGGNIDVLPFIGKGTDSVVTLRCDGKSTDISHMN